MVAVTSQPASKRAPVPREVSFFTWINSATGQPEPRMAELLDKEELSV